VDILTSGVAGAELTTAERPLSLISLAARQAVDSAELRGLCYQRFQADITLDCAEMPYNKPMFKKNTKHQQPALISAISELPEKQLKLLKRSWSESFYRDFFCKLDEEIFAVLYASEPSRPNVPVNVLVGLEVLKAGFGWSDEELFENFCFNLQVRYALGYDRLGDGDFAIRTLYYFRERLSKHYLETGNNLRKKAFEQVTDIQIEELQVRTGMQRMDSTHIAS